MKSLSIKSNIRDYIAYFEDDLSFLDSFRELDNRVLVVDKNVFDLYSKYIENVFDKDSIYLFEAKEVNKTLEEVQKIYQWLTKLSAKRNVNFISIGGGITQDVTGFVASTLYRGINWIFIPTTLLAQTDSCIGSKTSLNFGSYKNLVGTFFPPTKLYISAKFHKTLSELDIYSGYGEIIKFLLMEEKYPKRIDDIISILNECKQSDDYLSKQIFTNLNIKKSYMENDEFDLGKRNLLNYGHCFGHALESSSNYYVPHGIAVNIGIIFANIVSLKSGYISDEIFNQITNELNIPNIYLKLREDDFKFDKILYAMKNDKKRVGENLSVVIAKNENFELVKKDNITELMLNEYLTLLKSILFK